MIYIHTRYTVRICTYIQMDKPQVITRLIKVFASTARWLQPLGTNQLGI